MLPRQTFFTYPTSNKKPILWHRDLDFYVPSFTQYPNALYVFIPLLHAAGTLRTMEWLPLLEVNVFLAGNLFHTWANKMEWLCFKGDPLKISSWLEYSVRWHWKKKLTIPRVLYALKFIEQMNIINKSLHGLIVWFLKNNYFLREILK